MFAPWRSQNPVRKTRVSDYWKIIHWNKKSLIKIATTRLCDQWKMLQFWRRARYLPSFFVPTPGDLTAEESPLPGISHPRRKKKMLMPGGGGQPEEGGEGGARRSRNWLMHYSFLFGANCYAIWSMADAVFPHQMKQCQTFLDIASQTKWF